MKIFYRFLSSFSEKKIRQGEANSNELMNKWFELVTEKNQLLRHENKLMIEQRELQLQVPHSSSPPRHFEIGPYFSFWVCK